MSNKKIPNNIDIRELGRELQRARLNRGMKQSDAAEIINVSRTTITAIEKGERRIKAEELMKLANVYGRKVSDFVRNRPQIESFQFQFRGPQLRNIEKNQEIKKYIDQLEELSRNYVELENITNSPLVKKYPHEYDSTGIISKQAAETLAHDERQRLGLADGPIPVLRELLEQDVGLRIFYLPLVPSTYSAIYLYDHELGGCIAVNQKHPEERRRWSLAHDYGHFLAHRYKPTVFIEDSYIRIPESEQFADYFAKYFLMPTNGLAKRFNGIKKTNNQVTIADICTLAHYFGVSVAAITIRLEDMKLLPSGTWDNLKERGFKVREAQQELSLGTIPMQYEKLPIRYRYLAVYAFENALISEGQLANHLQVDRLEARGIAKELQRHAKGITNTESIELDIGQSLFSKA